MKILTKLIIGYALVASMVGAVGGAAFYAADRMKGIYDDVTKELYPVYTDLLTIRGATYQMLLAANKYLLFRHEAAGKAEPIDTLDLRKQDFEDSISLLATTLKDYETFVLLHYPDEHELLDDIKSYGQNVIKQAKNLAGMRLQDANGGEAILSAWKTMEKVESDFLDKLEVTLAHEEEEQEEVSAAFEDIVKKTVATIAVVSALSFLFALGGGVIVSRRLARPIIQLKDVVQEIRQGHWNKRAPVSSDDEIGILGEAFNEMMETLSVTTVSKGYVDNILSSMLDTLVVVDTNGNIQRTNHALLRLLGYAREEELLGRPASEILQHDSFQAWFGEGSASSAPNQRAEAKYLHKDGHLIPMLVSTAALRDAEGCLQGSVLAAQDITELKQAELVLLRKTAELEYANSELNKFAYITSHDLKAPLRAISNLAHWIEEDISDKFTDENRKQMELLQSRVVRMENLINGILEYSRIGRIGLKAEKVDTHELLEEITNSLDYPPQFQINIGADMPLLTCPRLRLSQVFTNLISNAVKYRSHDDGRVDVSVRDLGEFYEFTVSDDGIGIDPQFHEKVFVIFQTIAARDKIESTGIGLTVVKKIVEEQGGQISVESADGQGSAFRFTWPKGVTEETQG